MIQIATAVPTVSAGPARPVLLAAQSGASNFALALSSLLAPGTPSKTPPGEALLPEVPISGRQMVAVRGKELPEIGLDLSRDEDVPEQNCDTDDKAPEGEDLPFAWFALPAPPVPDLALVTAPVIAPKVSAAEATTTEVTLPDVAMLGAQPGPAKIARTSAPIPGAPGVQPKPADIALPQAPTPGAPVAQLQPEAGARPEVTMPGAPVPQPRSGDVSQSETPISGVPGAQPMSPETVPLAVTGEAAPIATRVAPDVAAAMPRQPFVRPLAVATGGQIDAPEAATATASPVPATAPAIPTVPALAPMVAAAATAIVQPPGSATLAPAAPPADGVPEVVPATVDAPAPRVQASAAVAQAIRQSAIDTAPPLTVASLIAQASVQTAAQPIAFVPLRRAFAETDQPVTGGIAPPGAAILQQVAATPDTQQGALDMRRQEWMGKMVETIEAMRDAAPVKETRIRLMPDALGKVDIAVRQDGDRVHVHFSAETLAARQILTDAQPRLAELAEARGIRLGQTSVDSQSSAGAQSGQRQNDAPRPQNSSAPASARSAKDRLSPTDDRVA